MLFTVLAALVVLFFLWVRFAPTDASRWHVDPETVQKTRRPNQFLMRDGADADSLIFALPAAQLAAKFDQIARRKPGVSLVDGDPASGWATYVQRTKLMKYPDYISVRITDQGDGTARLSVYSRSRFGRSDLGVNKARMTKWLAALGEPVAR